VIRHLLPAVALLAAGAAAEDYPSRPVRFIVPFPPGGGNDTMARTIGNKLASALSQQFVVENRAGAGGVIGELWLQIVHVPYKGLSPALPDLLSGQVQLMFSSTVAILPQVRSGRLRPLAMTSAKRALAMIRN
jgi:tripartite-type tricarboxylate transporter receptor subunit TctC